MNNKMQFPFWNTDWMQNQKQYMDAWSSFQQFMPNLSSDINPMYAAMNNWWNDASPSLSGQNHDFYNKMMQQAKSFYLMGDQFNKLLEGMKDQDSQTKDWQKILNDNFEAMKSIFNETNASIQDSFAASPFMRSGAHSGAHDEYFKMAGMTSFIDKLLSVPGLGPDREAQAEMQKAIKQINEYQQLACEFQTQISKAGVEALEAMRSRILEMAEQGDEINSLHEIYDLWVDCNEKAYAELVYTDEYSELYGRLTNAQLAVKQHQGKVVDKLLAKLNIPTRQGMNTVLQRVQEMKRTQSNSAAKITALEKELQALRLLVEGEKKHSSSTTKRSVAGRKKANENMAGKEPVRKDTGKTLKKVSQRISKKGQKKTAKKSSANRTIVIDI